MVAQRYTKLVRARLFNRKCKIIDKASLQGLLIRVLVELDRKRIRHLLDRHAVVAKRDRDKIEHDFLSSARLIRKSEILRPEMHQRTDHGAGGPGIKKDRVQPERDIVNCKRRSQGQQHPFIGSELRPCKVFIADSKETAAISDARSRTGYFDLQFVEASRLRIERSIVRFVTDQVVTLIVKYLANAARQIVIINDR